MSPKDKGRGHAKGERPSNDFKEVQEPVICIKEQSMHEQSQATQPPASQPQVSLLQPIQAQESDTNAASVRSKTSVASTASHRGKKTKLHSSLTEEEEQSMVEWLERTLITRR